MDPQRDFFTLDDAVYRPSSSVGIIKKIVANINTLVEAAGKANLHIIWTEERHRPNHSDYGAEVLSVE
ncbi:hypothetical protein [Haloquadratum walsbyi]|uniref:hypothetical protein n=1 Tax=Haloquadratum walsbyi TaxID=293091 RepID=UPI00373FD4C2